MQPVESAARAHKLGLVTVLTVLAAGFLSAPARPAQLTPSPRRFLQLAGVSAPLAGNGLRVHIDFGEGSTITVEGAPIVSLDVVRGSTGGLSVKNLITTDDVGNAPSPGPSVYECADPAFEPTGYAWAAGRMPIAWRYRARSVPRRLGRRSFLKDLKKAFSAWPKAATACPQKSDSGLSTVYAGRTRKTVAKDGLNIVEMGSLGYGAVAATYQWYDGLEVIESDVRFARGAGWTTTGHISAKRHFFVVPGGRHSAATARPARGARRYRKYFVGNVAAHEVGNLIGLADLEDPHGELSMFALINRGEKKKLSLGSGDVLGSSVNNP